MLQYMLQYQYVRVITVYFGLRFCKGGVLKILGTIVFSNGILSAFLDFGGQNATFPPSCVPRGITHP